ncbi:hypothetical protein CHL78_008300 [Romboutsia weinsteinii]|uniref:Uncharacterized protein n=1 Tax=Romboutsia weinsteinii TaxID=2020949 RepID=A0A371J4S7_9FIRM|nr:hypothetical protein [Romboutsia weinsteinii]RDY27713.1 hypothetical protein CHL78_008300 [Romboutsia weinsteinii]
MDKNNKKKYIFVVIIITFLIIGAFKVREYYILKDCFVFSKDNIVSVWTSKKGTYSHKYNSHISEEDMSHLSKLLTSAKLEKSSIKEAPPSSVLIYLDGYIKDDKDDGFSIEYKRSLYLGKINNEKMYVILEVNKLRDDNSFNMKNIAQKFYTINSKELVKLIEKIDSK